MSLGGRAAWGRAAYAVTMAAGMLASASGAQAPRAGPDAPAGIDGDALAAFVNRFVANGLTRWTIAGAATAIVHRAGRVDLGGHGLANRERRIAVDPRTTRWHVASVTKLLTTIAVLQLVEGGRIALDADVNTYLGELSLPATFPTPVQVRDLLTHSSGMADNWVSIAATSPERVRPLDEFLRDRMPVRVEPPGTASRYSNIAFALAGYVVQRRSGVPYAQYVEDSIFGRLGLTGSHLRARPPDALDAVGYFYRERITPEPRLYEHVAPAGAAHMTAADAAALLGALLNGGVWRGRRVLSDSSVAALLRRQFANHPALPGYAWGFYELPRRDRRALIVAGEVPGFSTRALLLPETGLAVVVAVNRKDPSLALELFDSVMARLPRASAEGDDLGETSRPFDLAGGDIAVLAGGYRFNLEDRESFLRVGELFNPTATVHVLQRGDGDTSRAGDIRVTFQNHPRSEARFRRIGPLLFEEARTGERVAFRVDRGRSTHLFMSSPSSGPATFQRVPWGRRSLTNALVVGVSLITFVVTLAIVSGGVVMRQVRRPRGIPSRLDATDAFTRTVGVALVLASLVFFIGLVFGFAQMVIVHDDRFAFGVPRWFHALLYVPYLIGALAVLLTVRVAALWRRGSGPRTARLGWSGVAVISLVFVAWLWEWNLFGPHL